MELKNLNSDVIVSGLLGIPATFLATLLAFKKLKTKIAKEEASKSIIDAEKDVFDSLRAEVTRMAESNTMLSNTVTAMQLEIVKLGKENTALNLTINDMAKRINALSKSDECINCLNGSNFKGQ